MPPAPHKTYFYVTKSEESLTLQSLRFRIYLGRKAKNEDEGRSENRMGNTLMRTERRLQQLDSGC